MASLNRWVMGVECQCAFRRPAAGKSHLKSWEAETLPEAARAVALGSAAVRTRRFCDDPRAVRTTKARLAQTLPAQTDAVCIAHARAGCALEAVVTLSKCAMHAHVNEHSMRP